MVKITYREMVDAFRKHNEDNNIQSKGKSNPLTGVVVITEDSFTKPYPIEARSYKTSSDNKAFISGMGGYSIYGSSLDGLDNGVRLEGYLAMENGGKDGWKVDYCYLL